MRVVHEFDTQKPWWARWPRRKVLLALVLTPAVLIGAPLLVMVLWHFATMTPRDVVPVSAPASVRASSAAAHSRGAPPHALQESPAGEASRLYHLDRVYEDWAIAPLEDGTELVAADGGVQLWRPEDASVQDDFSLGHWQRPTALAIPHAVLLVGWHAESGTGLPPRPEFPDRPADVAIYSGAGLRLTKLTLVRSDYAVVAASDGDALVIGGVRGASHTPLPEVERVSWDDYGPHVRRVADTRHSYYRPRAVALGSGHVMVVGGAAPGTGAVHAEIYDSRTGQWTEAPTPSARGNPLPVATRDGDVILISDGIEIYDHQTHAWRTAQAPRATNRRGAAAVMLDEKRLLLIGGGEIRETEIFDLAANNWVAGPTLAMQHESPAVRVLHDGSIAIVGGYDGTGHQVMPFLEVLAPTVLHAPNEPGTLAWATREATLTRLADGRVLVSGGLLPDGKATSSSEIIDPATLISTPTGPLNHARGSHQAVPLADGRVLALGGRDDTLTRRETPRTQAELFDPHSKAWKTIPGLDLPGMAVEIPLVLHGGKQLIGFEQNEIGVTAAWIWDRDSGRRSPLPLPASGRQHFDALELADGRLVVLGGTTPSDVIALEPRCPTCAEEYAPFGDPLPSVSSDVFDFDTQHWQPGPTANAAGGKSLRLRDGRIFKVAVVEAGDGKARLASEIADKEFTRWKSSGSIAIDERVGATQFQLFDMGARVAVFTRNEQQEHHAFFWLAGTGELLPWPRGDNWREVAQIDDHHLLIVPDSRTNAVPKTFEIVETP